MDVTETGQAGIDWETIVASLRNIHERGGWDITPHPMRYGQELFVVLDLDQEELQLVDEHDVRDRPVFLELSAHTTIGERYIEEAAWIDSDVFTKFQVWADSPSFVVEVTAKLVELLDNTLQYALPQLS